MTSGSVPRARFPRKGEPIGWNFEEVRYREKPIPEKWSFISWANTEHYDTSSPSPYSGRPEKLLYHCIKNIEEKHLGSGIIVDKTQGEIIGCYKVHADMDAGRDTREELRILKEKMRFEEVTGASADIIEQDATPEVEESSIAGYVRRLNGLLLDRRPAAIADHREKGPVFILHPDMIGHSYETYGDQYLTLEDEIRKAMGDTFDEDDDLPLFRKEQIKAAAQAENPDVDLTEEEVEVVDDDETQEEDSEATV